MRKITFIESDLEIKKLMIYGVDDEVYLFIYKSLEDKSCDADYLFPNLDEAEEYAEENFGAENNNWILISDPLENCQHDFIMPTKLNGDSFTRLNENQSRSMDRFPTRTDFGGLTVNERLFLSGLIEEFHSSKQTDKLKANKILKSLKVDEKSISALLS